MILLTWTDLWTNCTMIILYLNMLQNFNLQPMLSAVNFKCNQIEWILMSIYSMWCVNVFWLWMTLQCRLEISWNRFQFNLIYCKTIRTNKSFNEYLTKLPMPMLIISIKKFIIHRTFYLTLCLMGGGIECPPLAKSAPVHQGLTFEWPWSDDNSYLYIYY